MLLVAGEKDRIVDPQSVGDWGQSITQAEIALLDECGHLPMVERPGELGARILAFLTGDERYMNYAREAAPTAVPEPPVEQEPIEPLESEPVANEGDQSEEEPVARPERPKEQEALGDLRWEFDVGNKPRPRRIAPESRQSQEPNLEEDAGVESAEPERTEPEGAGTENHRGESFQGESLRAEDVRAEDARNETDRRKRFSVPRRRENEEQEEAPASAPASETRSPSSEPPEKIDSPRPRRMDSGSGRVPEFPEDLFQWSDKPREPRVRRRTRDHSEEPEEPPEKRDNIS